MNCHTFAHERQQRLYIVDAQPIPRRVLEITGVYDLLVDQQR